MSLLRTPAPTDDALERALERLRPLRGLVATCVLTGTVDPDFAQAREEMRAWNIEHGLRAVEYRTEHAVLVESARDAVCAHALAQGYDWVLQIDADAAPFPPNALAHLLKRAYLDYPDADAFGAYAQLKQPPYLPTIDTGTGTWEPHFPGEGVVRVIRTGGHFLLTKRSAFEKMGAAPWFRTRLAARPLDALADVDNFARTLFDGRNPLEGEAWERLTDAAHERAGAGPAPVGEDSGFCDRLCASGGAIYVDCDLVAGHVARTYITPEMLRNALDARARSVRALCGVAA